MRLSTEYRTLLICAARRPTEECREIVDHRTDSFVLGDERVHVRSFAPVSEPPVPPRSKTRLRKRFPPAGLGWSNGNWLSAALQAVK